MKISAKVVDWVSEPYSLYLLLKDPDVSWQGKLKAGLLLAALIFYILDPIDLIPDLTPILGWLDDVAIIPIAMKVAEKVVPEIKLAVIRQKARASVRHILLLTTIVLTTMALLSLTSLGLLIYFVVRKLA